MFSTRERMVAFLQSDPQLWNEILMADSFKIVVVAFDAQGNKVNRELVLKDRGSVPGDEFVTVKGT